MFKKINPFLWFDTQAEEAVRFYLSVFKDGKPHATTRHTENRRSNRQHRRHHRQRYMAN